MGLIRQSVAGPSNRLQMGQGLPKLCNPLHSRPLPTSKSPNTARAGRGDRLEGQDLLLQGLTACGHPVYPIAADKDRES